MKSRTGAAGLFEQLADIGTVDSARDEIIRGDGLDSHLLKRGLAAVQPIREMARSVRESAHFSGRDIEQVLEAVCAVRDSPTEGPFPVCDEYAQARGHPGKMYGDHGAGKAGANDSDIEDGRDFSHGFIKDENGGNEVSVDYTILVGK